ncbi:FecR family protein [Abyssalbus ytuae]|uniref:FecR family protein n=1 Tax=Abyssalbus ytuae TaxID=2926907 RepID=A0A9E6ZUB7_9FLAO|nr:FecR family protein [Abyssalbus ytuae]UOB17953.1 FecR family protein [Abyssalbus ytuae]
MEEKEIENKLKKVWGEQPNLQDENKIEESWDKFSSRAFPPKKKRKKYWYYAAAAVLLISLSITGFLVTHNNGDDKNIVVHNFNIIENPSQQKKLIYLPDSSVVELEPYSRLEYADNFIKNRKIHLQGEAYFKVEKDKQHPFQVFCKETTTTVLGTAFTVKEDPDNTISIKLYEGSIQMNVKDSTNNWLLSAGEKFVYNQKNLTIEAFNRFIDFNNEPLSAVVQYIRQNYDYKIVLPQDFSNKQVTLRISKKEELSNIINILAEIYNLNPQTNEDLKKITFQ